MLRFHRQFIVLRYTGSHTASGKWAEKLYRVVFEGANLIKISLVMAAAMLAICLLTLVETTNTAEAEDSLPENGKIAFHSIALHSGEGKIYTVEPDGSNLKQLTGGTYPTWSPDGTEILVAEPDGAPVSVVSADGPNVGTFHTIGEAFTYDSTWFPDGTKLAFSGAAHTHGSTDIFMMDLDGSDQTNLTKTPRPSEHFPAFSPNGSQICFSRESAGHDVDSIYVMDADGSDPTLLLETESPEFCDWSPAGKKIALSTFINPAEGDREVYVIKPDGSGGTALTRNSALDDNPAWSPDGTKITFASDRDGDLDFYTMDADGSDVAQVTNLPGTKNTPTGSRCLGPRFTNRTQEARPSCWQRAPYSSLVVSCSMRG
jgi:TolB protein